MYEWMNAWRPHCLRVAPQSSWGAGWRSTASWLPSAPTPTDTSCRTCSPPPTGSASGGRRRRFPPATPSATSSSTSPPSGRSSTFACGPTSGWWRRAPWWSGTTTATGTPTARWWRRRRGRCAASCSRQTAPSSATSPTCPGPRLPLTTATDWWVLFFGAPVKLLTPKTFSSHGVPWPYQLLFSLSVRNSSRVEPFLFLGHVLQHIVPPEIVFWAFFC